MIFINSYSKLTILGLYSKYDYSTPNNLTINFPMDVVNIVQNPQAKYFHRQ